MSYLLRRYPKKIRDFRRPVRRSFSQTDIKEEMDKILKEKQESHSFSEGNVSENITGLTSSEGSIIMESQTVSPEKSIIEEDSEKKATSKLKFEEETKEIQEGEKQKEEQQEYELRETQETKQSEFIDFPQTSEIEKMKGQKQKPFGREFVKEEFFKSPEQTYQSSYETKTEPLKPEISRSLKTPEMEMVSTKESEKKINVQDMLLLSQIRRILLIIRVFFLLFVFLLVLVLFLFTESLKERDFIYIGTFFIDFVKLFPVFLFITITFVLISAYLQLSGYTTASIILIIFSVIFITLSIIYLLIVITGLQFDILKYITVLTLFISDIIGIILVVSQFWFLKKKKLLMLQEGYIPDIQETEEVSESLSLQPTYTTTATYSGTLPYSSERKITQI